MAKNKKKGSMYKTEDIEEPLTKSMYYLLAYLKSRARGEYVYRIDMKQVELAKELNISRQALSVKLRPLIQRGYIRTGRGFIELTEKGLSFLGYHTKPVYILASIEPTKRFDVYAKVKEKNFGKVSRIAGDMDLIIEVDGTKAADVLNFLSRLEGVRNTKTYFTLEEI